MEDGGGLWVPKTPYGAPTSLRIQLCFITIAPSLSLRLYCRRAGGGLARCKCMGGAAWVRLGHGPKTTRWNGDHAREEESGRHPLVVMVQTAQVLDLDHWTLTGRLNVASIRAVHLERLMAAPPMIVVEVTSEDAPQVLFVQHDHVIEHSRRIEPTRRSTNGFCHGDRAAMTTSSMPMFFTRRQKCWP